MDTNACIRFLARQDMILISPDAVQATEEYKMFVQHLTEKTPVDHQLGFQRHAGNRRGRLAVSIPMVKQDGQWFFDTAAGKEEILARRIGGTK